MNFIGLRKDMPIHGTAMTHRGRIRKLFRCSNRGFVKYFLKLKFRSKDVY